jgi:ubiquinone/menaquinone biosynthesis C-methylase UbiE
MKRHLCPFWVGYLLLSPLRKLVENPDKIFKPLVREGMVVLEPGCGMGYFTLPLARMVGPSGRVIAADIQTKMLGSLARRAQRANLSRIIEARLITSAMPFEDLENQVDFIAAIHMVHETSDSKAFFAQMAKTMKTDARMLILEPKGHVSEKAFTASLDQTRQAGLIPVPGETDPGKRRALLYKPGSPDRTHLA